MSRTRRFLALLAAIPLVVALASCTGNSGANNPKTASGLQKQGQQLTQQAFAQQQSAEPYPAALLRDSTERANLIRHLLRFNDPNKIGYVYIMNFGKIVGYYVIKGKVSSNDSQLTTSQLVIHDGYPNGGEALAVPAPGDDGSYGANEPGVFFFTTNNVMVVTDLDYVYSDQPLPINAPVLGGDPNATESPAQLMQALKDECKAVGKAAGINSTAAKECSQEELQKIAPSPQPSHH